ncbi:MAG: PorT family protein [Bacteroidales bacterium]|jgi:hypothetical protein|nr:PorT family protein [Bacteroidales bacterium]
MKNAIAACAVAAVLSVGTVFAQDVKFGLRAGVNLPNIKSGGKNTPVSEGYSSRLASGIGLFTELQLNPKWSVRLGVEYSGQGGKKDGLQAMPTMRLITGIAGEMGMAMAADPDAAAALMGAAAQMPQYYYANVNNTVRFDYAMIPVLAQYSIALGESPWSVYVNAGPFVSFLVSGKQISSGNSRLYADAAGQTPVWDALPLDIQQTLATAIPNLANVLQNEAPGSKTNITGEMKSTNFGVIGNIGIRYQCGRNAFFVEGGGNYGFVTVQQDDANGSNRLGAASIMAGYAFSFF